jgi:DNA-binding MarR family transcriptional regulator
MSRDSREKLIGEVAEAIRAYGSAQDLLDESAAERLGINRTDARVLDVLERSGQLAAGAIAEQSGLTTGAVTGLLDRLERAGYVRRIRDQQDRRRVLVELTPTARKLTLEVYGPIGAEGLRELERYSDQQLRLLCDHHQRGAEFLTRHATRLKAEAATKPRRRTARRSSD